MKRQFLVTIDIPESWTIKDVAKQIREDIGSWAGAKSPDDPMHELAKAKRTVKVDNSIKFKCGYCDYKGNISPTTDYIRCPNCGGL